MKLKGNVSSSGVSKGGLPLGRGSLRGRTPLISRRLRGVFEGGFPSQSATLKARRSLLHIPKIPHYIDSLRKVAPVKVERYKQPLLADVARHIRICKSRHIRREVLFANRGLNGRAHKKYTEDSKVRC